MPTYKNSTLTTQYIAGQRLEVGEKLATSIWFTSLPTGVTKESDAPFYNPIIYSAKVTGAGSYAIPSNVEGNYEVKIYVATGDATIKFNSSDAVAKVVGLGETYSVFCSTRIIDSIIYSPTGNSYITVSRV